MSAEMRVVIDRYFGAACRLCLPHVGPAVREATQTRQAAVLDEYGVVLANANVGGDRWRERHDAVLSVIQSELHAANQVVRDNVYGLFESTFGDGSNPHEAANRVRRWGDQKCGEGDRRRRRRQGLIPDLLVEDPVNHLMSVVRGRRTLFELKQINFLAQYTQKNIRDKLSHAVQTRAGRVHTEYCRKLHEVDKIAGMRCAATRTGSGKCSYADRDAVHAMGGGEKFLESEFGEVQPLVFGHFGEINVRFQQLLDATANTISVLHHREHGWKNAKAGFPRAKTGIMRSVSMAILKAHARHVRRGLEIIVPQAMHTHTARRARSEAARQADFDEFRHDIRANGCRGPDGRD
jgi:hypothetical protein